MRLEKKEVFQRIQQNKKRLNLFQSVYQILLALDAQKKIDRAESQKLFEQSWSKRIALAKRLGAQKEGYIDPNVLDKEPIVEEPFLVSSEVLEASRKENVPLVDKLIEEAVQNDDIKLVERLIFRNVPGRGQSRLDVAFKRGYLTAAQYFVDKGDDINAKDGRGQTLFHWQAKQMSSSSCYILSERDRNALEFLLCNAADSNAVDFLGYTPAHYAGPAAYTFKEQVALIGAYVQEERNTKICEAFNMRDLPALEKLVYEGLPTSARRTMPRIVAALEQGYEDVAFLFAMAGDNVDIRNEQGETLLYVAAAEMSFSKVSALLRMNADPNAVAYHGGTPLMAAWLNRNASEPIRRAIVSELLEYGADDKMMDCKWNSAYSYAKSDGVCLRDEIECIKKSSPPLTMLMVGNKVYSLVG